MNKLSKFNLGQRENGRIIKKNPEPHPNKKFGLQNKNTGCPWKKFILNCYFSVEAIGHIKKNILHYKAIGYAIYT